MYTILKLKVHGQLYAILGQLTDGSYQITPMAEVMQHGLMPLPWLEYLPENVLTVTEDSIESFLAYSI